MFFAIHYILDRLMIRKVSDLFRTGNSLIQNLFWEGQEKSTGSVFSWAEEVLTQLHEHNGGQCINVLDLSNV